MSEMLKRLQQAFDEAENVLSLVVVDYSKEEAQALGEDEYQAWDTAVRLKTELENAAANCEE